jgi:hypothetical protein
LLVKTYREIKGLKTIWQRPGEREKWKKDYGKDPTPT